MTRLWHPFADMAVVKDAEVVIERGDGAVVWDEQGREYIDARGGLWYCAAGHGRGEIADAAAAQMRKLAAYDTFERLANRPALDLAERVAELSPLDGAAVFFTSGGSEAVDTAAKLARRYWHALDRPQKQVIVHRRHAYHGMNAYGTSLAGIPANREGFGTLIPDVAVVSDEDPAELAALLEERAGDVAAFIGEPVIGAGGILHPPPGYWDAVQELCRRHDVLLIADEVITGFGRLGRWFGSERLGIAPDLITCAKAITSGYQPLGAVIASARVQEPFWTSPGTIFRHGFTYSGHPTACAAGMANLDLMQHERLVERVAELEPVLADAVGAAHLRAPRERGARRAGAAGRDRDRPGRPGGRPRHRRADRARLPRPRRAHARAGRARPADLAAVRDHPGAAPVDGRRDGRRDRRRGSGDPRRRLTAAQQAAPEAGP